MIARWATNKHNRKYTTNHNSGGILLGYNCFQFVGPLRLCSFWLFSVIIESAWCESGRIDMWLLVSAQSCLCLPGLIPLNKLQVNLSFVSYGVVVVVVVAIVDIDMFDMIANNGITTGDKRNIILGIWTWHFWSPSFRSCLSATANAEQEFLPLPVAQFIKFRSNCYCIWPEKMGYAEFAGNACHRSHSHIVHMPCVVWWRMKSIPVIVNCSFQRQRTQVTHRQSEEKTNIKILSPFARFLMHAFNQKPLLSTVKSNLNNFIWHICHIYCSRCAWDERKMFARVDGKNAEKISYRKCAQWAEMNLSPVSMELFGELHDSYDEQLMRKRLSLDVNPWPNDFILKRKRIL